MSLSSLIRFFQAPIFEDEAIRRRAQLLSFLANLHLAVAVSVAVIYLTVVFDGFIYPIIALASCLPALAVRWLIRRGRVTHAAIGFVAFIALLMPLTAFMSGSSAGSVPMTAFQFVTIVMAGLLLGGRGALGFVTFTVLINGGLLYAETRRWYEVDTARNPAFAWTAQTITYSAAAALLWMANRLIQQSLARASQELAERRQTEFQLQQRAEEMYLLYKMGVALTSGQDLYHALRALVKELRRLMIVDAFYVVIYDELSDEIAYPLYLNLEADLRLPPRKLSANPGLTGEVIAARRTLYLPDISQPEVQAAHQIVVIVDMGVHSYVGIPLIMDDRIIGVLSVQAREANAYSNEQIRMLETLATEVAITVEKSRLWEQLQQELVERKRAEAEVRQLNAELEGRVERRTAELAAANKELESFSYSVSHDLRAPLRGIAGFTRLLSEGYAQRLDAEGLRYLQRVRSAATRMGELIDDLLAFSRLGRRPLNTQRVEPARLVRALWNELKPHDDQRVVEFRLGDLPACQADPGLLRQVFANLLENALKYSHTREVGRIEVGWQAGAYFVRDNGVGFEMQYADKLFGVFQRLHRDEDFEGTGVGLATVKRIVERHGGRIWAEGEVGRGATFYFSLP